MAKKSKTATKSGSNFLSFFTDKTFHFIVGSILGLFFLWTTVAFISFLFTGKNDQSLMQEVETQRIEYNTFYHNSSKTEADKEKLREMKNKIGETKSKFDNVFKYSGAVFSERIGNGWFGLGVLPLCVFGFLLSLWFLGLRRITLWKWFLIAVFLSLWLSLLMGFVVDGFTGEAFVKYGGNFGMSLSESLRVNIGNLGLIMVLVGSGLIFMVISVSGTIPFFKNIYHSLLDKKLNFDFSKKNEKNEEEEVVLTEYSERTVKIGDDIVPDDWKEQPDSSSGSRGTIIFESDTKDTEDDIHFQPEDDDIFVSVEAEKDNGEEEEVVDKYETEEESFVEVKEDLLEKLGPYDPRKDLSQYRIPLYTDTYRGDALLKDYPSTQTPLSDEDKSVNRRRIVETLQKFGIAIKKIYETIGPTITLYEIVPEDGVRINKIRNLADDIMLSLAATGIRIIAPIPGKGTIGIEVPNSNPQIVSMYATLASKKFQESKYDLPIALGRTITNEVFMFDLTKMPHLLVAGATGQGKSVGLNAIITSLLFKKHPSELKFVLIDPKKVEFNIYADIEKHFLAKLPEEEEPVITDVEKVKQTLNSLCKEMDERYDLLKLAHARNVKEYNDKFIKRQLNPQKGHRYMPYIVVIVDEFGDLIMTAGKEVEMPIARIAQLARAVGIHMVIATQRPSVNIITGVIKANFPARIAFKVSSGVDSKTILDGSGAQQLIGRGDLLFSQGNEPTRVQCAFVDTPEVENIVHFISDQQSYPAAFALPEPDAPSVNGEQKTVDITKRDSLFDEVARYVVSSQQGSTSTVQRKFEIGFNRAGRIVDQLEAAGIVGPIRGSKPREVLVQTEYDLEKILSSI